MSAHLVAYAVLDVIVHVVALEELLIRVRVRVRVRVRFELGLVSGSWLG